MNKALDKYAEKQGFKKEWELAPYSAWFHRVAELSLGEGSLMDEKAVPRDMRIQGACLMLALASFVAGTTVSLALWAALFVINRAIRRLRRPSYYPQERERRQRLRAERRKIRPRTTQNDCPTPEALLAQFTRAKDSPEEMLRFGSMLEDLECYVDNSLVFDENGGIAGRKGGIRGWLKEHCLKLSARYKTVMRYKAMAKKFRQVVDIRDPVPATALFGPSPSSGLEKPAQTAKAFLTDCKSTQIDVLWQLERRLNPEWAAVGRADALG